MSNLQLKWRKYQPITSGKSFTSNFITVEYGCLGSFGFSVEMGKCGFDRKEMS